MKVKQNEKEAFKPSIFLVIVLLAALAALTDVKGYETVYNLGKCTVCHGKDFEKKAFGKSQIVKDMNESEIVIKLKGYRKPKTSLGNVMKSQIRPYTDKDLEEIAKQILE